MKIEWDKIMTPKRLPLITEEFKRKFLSNIIELSNGCCILKEGLGCKKHSGYRIIKINGKSYFAHRIAYKIFYGDFDEENEIIHHICQNRECVFHLEAKNKKYHITTAKLTKDQVLEIYYNKTTIYEELGKKYNVNALTIQRIKSGRSWSHITRAKNTKKKKPKYEFWNLVDDHEMILKFKSLIKINSETGCHEWQGKMHLDGYGRFNVQMAHIIAWELKHKKKKSENMVIMHNCNNKICCYADDEKKHLELGTQSQNIEHMVNQTGFRILTDCQVLDMRREASLLPYGQKELFCKLKAEELKEKGINIAWKTIIGAINGSKYKHLNGQTKEESKTLE